MELPRTFSLKSAGLMVVAALCVGWIGRGTLNAAPQGASLATFDTWRMTCPDRSQSEASCEISQDFVDSKSGATVMRFAISANQDKPTIDVLVPHNVLLPKGISLKVGEGEPKTFPYRTCTAAGCLATIKPDSGIYNAALRSGQLAVSFARLDGRPVTRKTSDKGFDDAVSAMKTAEAKRHSWIRRVVW